MSDFRFGLGDRANVPHFINVQGVVQGCSDHMIDGKKYLLRWLSDFTIHESWFTADDVAKANGIDPAAIPDSDPASIFDPPAPQPKAKLFGKSNMKPKPKRKR